MGEFSNNLIELQNIDWKIVSYYNVRVQCDNINIFGHMCLIFPELEHYPPTHGHSGDNYLHQHISAFITVYYHLTVEIFRPKYNFEDMG